MCLYSLNAATEAGDDAAKKRQRKAAVRKIYNGLYNHLFLQDKEKAAKKTKKEEFVSNIPLPELYAEKTYDAFCSFIIEVKELKRNGWMIYDSELLLVRHHFHLFVSIHFSTLIKRTAIAVVHMMN